MSQGTLRKLRRNMPRTMEYAQEMGWQLLEGRGPHPSLVRDGRRVAIPGTPSEYRSDTNARAQLKRIDREDGYVPTKTKRVARPVTHAKCGCSFEKLEAIGHQRGCEHYKTADQNPKDVDPATVEESVVIMDSHEVAELLGVTPDGVRQWVNKGLLAPAYPPSRGRRTKFDAREVERFEQERQKPSKAKKAAKARAIAPKAPKPRKVAPAALKEDVEWAVLEGMVRLADQALGNGGALTEQLQKTRRSTLSA